MNLKICLLFLSSQLCLYNLIGQDKRIDVVDQAIKWHQQGKSLEAIRLLEEDIHRLPTTTKFEIKSQLEESVGRLSEAQVSISRAIELSVDRGDLYFKRAMLFYVSGQHTLAIKDFDTFLKNPSPNTTAVYFQLDPHELEQAQVKTSNMISSEALMHRGLSYAAIDSLDQAETDMQAALLQDSLAPYFLNFALVKMKKKDSVAAIQAIQASLSLDSSYVLGWYNLKILKPEVSIPSVLRESATLFPLLYYDALDALSTDEVDLGVRLSDDLLFLYPERSEVYALAGRLAYKQRKYDDALRYFLYGTKISSGNGEFHLLLANTYFQLESYEAAVSHYELLLVSDPLDPEIGFNAAVAYHRLEDYTNMCRCLQNIKKSTFQNSQLSQMLQLCK